MQPLNNVLVTPALLAVSSDLTTDLPVNPLYCILYTLTWDQAAAAEAAPIQVMSNIPRIEVLFRGTTIVSGSLNDIAAVNGILTRRPIAGTGYANQGATGLALTVPIYLGRKRLAGMEAFPATRRGELTLHRTVSAAIHANIAAGTLREQIETVELLGAEPSAFLKYTTITRTPPATGDNDIDLPLGNPLIGCVLFGSTAPAAHFGTSTILTAKLLVDNVEFAYALTQIETLHMDLNRTIPLGSQYFHHFHTNSLPSDTLEQLIQYNYLDFDPFEDDQALVQTAGRGRVHLRVNVGVTTQIRALPIERIDLAGAQT